MDFLKDMFGFLKERKKIWLIPAIVILLLISLLIVVTGGSAIAPFIYTLF
jgi:competence protein ComGC